MSTEVHTAADAGGPVPVGPPRRSRVRLAALDWARGWLIIINLVAIVYASAPGASAQLRHATWFGVTAFDLIFPAFVCLSGCGLAFAYRRPVPARVTARRVLVLFALGLGYNAALDRTTDLGDLRLTGPLQVYAVLTLVVALLHLVLRSTRAWAVFTLVLAGAVTVLFVVHDAGCDLGQATRACNLSAATDLRLFPDAMLYREGADGHDPEGVMTALGALLTLCVGLTAGRILSDRTSPKVVAGRLLAWTASTLVIGALLTLAVEPYKRLWTPSFALVTGALVVGVLLLGWLLHDAPLRGGPLLSPRRSEIVLAHGRNPLLIYFGAHLVLSEMSRWGGDPDLLTRLLEAEWPWGHPVLTLAVLFTGAWALLAWVLHRHRLYLRA